MSRFHERARQPQDKPGDKPRWYDALHAVYPEVANVLSGSPGEPPDVPPVEPCSIIISQRQGKLQFCISRQGGQHLWFGAIDEPSELLKAIDQAIAFDELTYQQKTGKGYRP